MVGVWIIVGLLVLIVFLLLAIVDRLGKIADGLSQKNSKNASSDE